MLIFISHIYLIMGSFFFFPQSSIPPSTYFVHRPGSESLQQLAEHRSILQRGLEKSLRIRDAFLGRIQDPEGDEPGYRLLGRIHAWNIKQQQQQHCPTCGPSKMRQEGQPRLVWTLQSRTVWITQAVASWYKRSDVEMRSNGGSFLLSLSLSPSQRMLASPFTHAQL